MTDKEAVAFELRVLEHHPVVRRLRWSLGESIAVECRYRNIPCDRTYIEYDLEFTNQGLVMTAYYRRESDSFRVDAKVDARIGTEALAQVGQDRV